MALDVAVEWSGGKERKTRTRGRDDRETRDATWRRALISEICPALGLFAHSSITITCETRSAFVRAPTFVNLLLEVMGSGEGGKVVEVSLGA